MRLLILLVALAAFPLQASNFYDSLSTVPTVQEVQEHGYYYPTNINFPHNATLLQDELGCTPSATGSGLCIFGSPPTGLNAPDICKAGLFNHTGQAFYEDAGSAIAVESNNDIQGYPAVKVVLNCSITTSTGVDPNQVFNTLAWSHNWPIISITAESCPSASTLIDGNCYDDLDIQNNDSCDNQTPWLPADASTNENVCTTLNDGSKCAMERGDTSQTYFTPKLEPSTCHNGEYSDYDADYDAPTGDDCVDIGNSVVACPENELNVCSTSEGVQTCQSGCGNVSFGATSGFFCFDDDTDGDGIGNYADPDIDGDGISNDLDIDADGDGEDDPTYDNGDGSNSGGNTYINSQVDEQKIIDGVVSGLTEQGDFEGLSTIANADAKLATNQSSIDTILGSDSIDFMDTIEDSGIDDSFDTLTSALSPSACSASFEVPFTGQNLDVCESATKAKPFLYVLFAVFTFIYIYRRVMSTARGSE